MQKPSVTIVIPVYNDESRLVKCLDALQRQDYPRENMSIYVIDNNSSTSLNHLVPKYNNLTLFHESKPGSYVARNKVLGQLNSDIIAFTDSDCIPNENWLTTSVEYLQKHGVDAVGGKVELFAANPKANIYELYDIVSGFNQKEYIEKDNFAATANLVVKTAIFEQLQGFNTELLSSGDKDFCHRLVAKGYTLEYCDRAVIQHPARNSWKQVKTKLNRLLGGFYHLHKNGKPQKLYTFFGLLEAIFPPVANLKRMMQSERKFNHWQKITLFGFFYYIKLYTLYYRVVLIFRIKTVLERN